MGNLSVESISKTSPDVPICIKSKGDAIHICKSQGAAVPWICKRLFIYIFGHWPAVFILTWVIYQKTAVVYHLTSSTTTPKHPMDSKHLVETCFNGLFISFSTKRDLHTDSYTIPIIIIDVENFHLAFFSFKSN